MEFVPVGVRDRGEFEAAGWSVPSRLQGSYRVVGLYTMGGDDAMEEDAEGDLADAEAFQVVYRDGLYTVSLFQQHGRPDWAAMPEGRSRVPELSREAFEWPGAVPHRMVWEASGMTYALVGDAPRDELLQMVTALPEPGVPSLWERVARGLGRLWSWVSPWS